MSLRLCGLQADCSAARFFELDLGSFPITCLRKVCAKAASHPDSALHLVTKILDLAFHKILSAEWSSERPEIADPELVSPSRPN